MKVIPRVFCALVIAIQPLSAGFSQASEAPIFREVARKEVKLDDHTITYVRVKPPVSLPKRQIVQLPAPTAQELADRERRAEKAHVILNVSAVVHLTTPIVTEIKLRCEDREYTCYSNADFRDLTQTTTFEGQDTIFSWFPWISEVSPEEAALPAGLNLSATEPEYLIQATQVEVAQNETAFEGLDLIHAFYQLNHEKLHADRLVREAEQAAREKELREHPPKKPDTVIYFWKKEAVK
jgi:hypothetical protein